MSIFTTLGLINPISKLNQFIQDLDSSDPMPLFFFGHGSPMNAIESNQFTQKWNEIGSNLPKPKAIICISAHWETKGSYVTAMEYPKTIHDFGGFPDELYRVQYSAPGSPELAQDVINHVTNTTIGSDLNWGLDHGCWSVVKHLYPKADIPIIQLSIDYTKDVEYHYRLAKELSALRSKGILIIGSGNIVHNLRLLAWDKANDSNYAYDWATEANNKMIEYILSGDYQPLIEYQKQGRAFQLAIPTPEHYIPLIYTLGLKNNSEKVSIFNNEALMGSITMTSVMIT
jgi:4,5-DOPA dioxygenase extradiol